MSAPSDSPLTRYLRMKGSNRNTGKMAQMVAADSRAMSTPRWVWKEDSPTGSVFVCGPLRISAKRNSFQLRMNASSPAARIPGRRPAG